MTQQPRTSHPVVATAARVLVRAGAVVVLYLLLRGLLAGVERLRGTDGPAGADIGAGIALLGLLVGAVVAGAARDGYRRGFATAARDWALAVGLLGLTAAGALVLGTVTAARDLGPGGGSVRDALVDLGVPMAAAGLPFVATAAALATAAAALADSARSRRTGRAA
jgi:hypothetical protein